MDESYLHWIGKFFAPLTMFGLFAVTAMLICYALEDRSSMVYSCLRGSLRARFHLWVSARRVAIRPGRGGLVRGRNPTMGAGVAGKVSLLNRAASRLVILPAS